MNRPREEEGTGDLGRGGSSSSSSCSSTVRGKARPGHSPIEILLSRSFVLDQIFLFLEGTVLYHLIVVIIVVTILLTHSLTHSLSVVVQDQRLPKLHGSANVFNNGSPPRMHPIVLPPTRASSPPRNSYGLRSFNKISLNQEYCSMVSVLLLTT